MEKFSYIKRFTRAYHIQFSPKGDYILSLSSSKITVIDGKNLNEIHAFRDIKYPGKVAFAFNNEQLFSSESVMKKLGVFKVDNEFSARVYRATKSNQPQDFNICFSPDNKKIIYGRYDRINNTISTIDLETSEVKDLKVFEDSFVKNIEYCETDNTYLFSIFDREGLQIEGEAYSITYILKWKYPFELNEPVEIRTDILLEWWDIRYNSNLKQYALYDVYDEVLIVTNDTLGKEIGRYMVHDSRCGYFTDLNWSYDGKYIVITFCNSVKIISSKDGKCIKEFKIPSGMNSEFSPDGKKLLVGTSSYGYLIDISEFVQ